MRVVLRGGAVVDGSGERRADVVVDGGVIAGVGEATVRAGDTVIDCSGRLVMPGLIDAHSHVDGLLTDDDVQRALLKQGVTSVIVGQDGVSYAPGDGTYASEYFAAINGAHPSYAGGGVAELLGSADGTSRINAAYVIPAGTVRWEVCARSTAPATPEQTAAMVALVEQGMAEGAVGLSTGLDYVPGIFASASELAALCQPVTAAGGIYVSHMRGGYEANSAAGIEEITAIASASGARVHISHFHAEAHIVAEQLDALAQAGVDATFDAYPYTRGCTLLGMPLLPPALAVQDVDEVIAAISDPAERAQLRREWFPEVDRKASLGPEWPSMITLGHVAAPEYTWAEGMTVAEAAERVGVDAIDLALDVLAASRLQVNAVMAVRYRRPVAELARIFAHPAHMGGSDGIFIGGHPHPRARGTFPRFLRQYVRETATWTWAEAVAHLSASAASRFSLGRRGRIEPGWIADIAIVDPARVADTATYESPHGEAVGIDDVLVAGMPVLRGGALAENRPGRGLRRDAVHI